MKKLISLKLATQCLIILFTAISLFHVTVLMGFIPIEIIWGGRLKTQSELVQFELVSLGLNGLMLLVVLLRANLISNHISLRIFKSILWIMVVLFIANTIGNLFAKNPIEQWVFSPITLLLSFCCYRLTGE